jgi:CPA2 family monovalent cation:H+ antiporter-2
MEHQTPLIATIVAGLVTAFVLGTVAQRLRASPIVGYLLAGLVIGPFTPGYVADAHLASELAEIGIILLMFGVGLHFSLKDLLSVGALAVPGAIVQIAVATGLGMGLAAWLGWPPAQGFVFGLALSVASTVVLLRALQERRILETGRGRIAVGWLIVEDVAMVLALVLLPILPGLLAGVAPQPKGPSLGAWIAAGMGLGVGGVVLVTLAKVAAFAGVMLAVGRRLIPAILHAIAHTGSRELFRLAVLAIALGIAFGAALLFGVSFALGAFFAGMVLSESELSHRAAEESLPLRDAFSVLFFVSVGMLFNPAIIVEHPGPLLATVAIVVIGKSVAAYAIVRAFGHPNGTALTISASLAQIGEFSFILAALGVSLGLLPPEGRDLVLAAAIISIVLNPIGFALVERRRARPAAAPAEPDRHAAVVGYGRVGRAVCDALTKAGVKVRVAEADEGAAEAARAAGLEAIDGSAVEAEIMAFLDLPAARVLCVAIPQVFEAGQVVAQARAANPRLLILARAHSDAEVAHLEGYGANRTIMGEREIARQMVMESLK